jgi:Cellulase (glycosyl hydrolase family 5)
MLAFPLRRPTRWLVTGLLLAVVSMLAVTPGIAPASPKAKAARAHAAVKRLKHASKAQRAADHRLVVKARRLKSCQRRHAGACKAQRRAVQAAGVRLHRAQRRLNRIARRQAHRARSGATVAAPALSVNGQKLRWNSVSNVNRYVLLRKVPGQADQYSVVKGTSTTPPAVPGQTVRYSVRSDAAGSAWSNEVSIAYAAVEPTPTPTEPAPEPAPSANPLAAPDITASGSSLAWNQVGTVTTYVLVRKVTGLADQYTVVSGTTTTPAPVAGKTARYGVRTAIDGSAWSTEVSITYPADPEPAPAPSPEPSPAPVDTSFQLGLVAGSAATYELPFLQQMGARTARLAWQIGTPVSTLAPAMDAYARAGVRPILLATFYGRNATSAEALSLASWAAAYGPGGTFWAGKSYPAGTGVTRIEFGNETSYSYQFSDNSLSTYAVRAQTYAQRAKEAATAIRAANANVGLLAIGDNAVNQSAWVVNLFKAVPDLDDYVSGWTIHPYGPNWATRIDSTINSTKTAGSRDLPVWVTEWGLSTDNGRCLSDNYGFDKCMTYDAAATTLRATLAGMQSRYGSRLGAFFLYQAHDQYASGSQTGREAFFGATQSNGAAKGAYTTEVKGALAANG